MNVTGNVDPSLPSPHVISSEQREQETGKKIMKTTFERFPISAPTCKETCKSSLPPSQQEKS